MKNLLKKKVFAAFALVLAVSIVAGTLFYLNISPMISDNLDSITVGMEFSQVNSLVFLAEDRGYFTTNGLNVTIKEYPSGLAATNGLLNGEVDMSTAAEFVLVGKALAKSGIKTLCSIDKFQQIYIVGNKDHGVNKLSDLQGKRVGLSLKTASEFYFGRFLQLNGLTLAAVTLVNISPSETVSAFANGTVDAVVTWQPNINSLQETVGNNTILWGAQSGQVAYCLALSTNEWIIDHPKVANRFLKSLLQAEDYLVGNIEQAKSRIQSILGYDQGYVNKIWSDHQFSLSLDQSLILALEDESRWEIGNQLASTTVVPNFLEYIYLDGLSVVRPESVTIIR